MRYSALILVVVFQATSPALLALVVDGKDFTPEQVRLIQEKANSRVNRLTPKQAQYLFDCACKLNSDRRSIESRALLSILTKSRYVNAATYCELASTYSDKIGAAGCSTLQEARKSLEKALQLDADCSEAYVALSEIDLQEGLKEQAVKNARRALACKKIDESAYLMLATALSTSLKYKEALSCLDKAEKVGHVGGQMYRVKAACLENLGRFDEAIAAYRKSLTFQQRDWTHFQIVRCLEAQHKYLEAIGELDMIIKNNSLDGEAYRMRASFKFERNDRAAALKDMERCIDLEPTVKSYKERARMHKLMGHETLAKKDLAEAERLINSEF